MYIFLYIVYRLTIYTIYGLQLFYKVYFNEYLIPQGDCDFFNEGAGGSPLYTAEEKKGYGDLSVAPHIPKNKKEGTVIFPLIH